MENEIDEDFDILPVIQQKQEIVEAIKSHQTILIIGETGSGKTSQIPQFCLDEGLIAERKMIAITQPRRVAAITISEHVSNERKCKIGEEVGYSVRFDDCTSVRTRIKYLTDGILIRECMADPDLSKYSVIMLDEAHERTLNTDILFGLLKAICKRRNDLKLLVTSANLDVDKLTTYFDCPVFTVPGRLFPVQIYHSLSTQTMTPSGPSSSSYVQESVDTALRIHREERGREKEGEGLSRKEGNLQIGLEGRHILVFLTGQDEIEKACELTREAVERERHSGVYSGLIVLPLYASLPSDVQRRAFMKAEVLAREMGLIGREALKRGREGHTGDREDRRRSEQDRERRRDDGPLTFRKLIFCTNIAETSVTVPHVGFVVDSGYCKQKAFDPDRHLQTLVTLPISQVSAQQRAGRAGRTGPGSCYRLYSTESYSRMSHSSVPEILRSPLSSTLLSLKALGIQDVLSFDLPDPPSQDQAREALLSLCALGALYSDREDLPSSSTIPIPGSITPLGQRMSLLPLEPPLSRALLAARDTGDRRVWEGVASIVSLLSSEEPFIRPSRRKGRSGSEGEESEDEDWMRAERAHQSLRDPTGDPITLLRLMQEFENAESQGREREGGGGRWCRDHFIRLRTMKTATKIKEQLLRDLISSERVGKETTPRPEPLTASFTSLIVSSLTKGLFLQAARCCGQPLAGPRQGSIHSSSLRPEDASLSLYRTLPLLPSEEICVTSPLPSSSIRCPDGGEVVFVDLVVGMGGGRGAGGKLGMRHVLRVREEELGRLKEEWGRRSPSHVDILSGLAPPSPSLSPSPPSLPTDSSPTSIEGVESGQGIRIESESVRLARERFLARKKEGTKHK